MKKRVRPTSQQTLGLMRHLSDVAALKSNHAAQRQHLIDGLNKLLRTKLGWFFTIDDWRPGRRVRITHQVLTSNPDANWVRYLSNFAVTHPVEADAYADHAIRSDEIEQQWTLGHVMPDVSAGKYSSCRETVRQLNLIDGMACLYRTGPAGDRVVGFSLHRDSGDAPLDESELALARMAVTEIRDLERRGHIVLRPQTDPPLTPRLTQVLERLLQGKNPKAIALELKLSVHTVREHNQRIYNHFKVRGRDELMAKFVKG